MNKISTNKETRFWEIDFLRGVAVVLMVLVHAVFDLSYVRDGYFSDFSGVWWLVARLSAVVFIVLVGLSLYLSSVKKPRNYWYYFKRGLMIFSGGLLITLVTRIFFKDYFVFFGVLHFIGLSIILAYPFLKLKWLNLWLGIFLIIFNLYWQTILVDFPWLLWLGLQTSSIATLDFFPLIPWFSLVLIGIFLGKVLYTDYKRQFNLLNFQPPLIFSGFGFLGKNSLLIYLIHQPALILVLLIFSVIDKMFK